VGGWNSSFNGFFYVEALFPRVGLTALELHISRLTAQVITTQLNYNNELVS